VLAGCSGRGRAASRRLDRPAPFGPPARFALLCASIVIGSFSHITWDAFTHQGGVVVNLWSGFSRRVGPGALPVYQWLQYASSLFGMIVLGVWAHGRPSAPARGCPPRAHGAVPDPRAVAAAVAGGLLVVGGGRRRAGC